MALGKDKGSVTKHGGGLIYVKRVSDSGGISTGATWLEMPFIQESTFAANGANEDIKDETGDVVANVDTDFGVKLTGIFMQCDKDTLDFLASHGTYSTTGARNNFFCIIAKRGTLNGKTQELAGAICKIKPGFSDATGTRRPPFEITMLKNTTGSAITITPPTGKFAATTFSVPNNEFYSLVET